jgi:hypothetical protein
LWDADLIDESQWFAEARSTTRDLLKELCELARSSAWSATDSNRPNFRITNPDDAERALCTANTPLKVLVENRLRDGALLEVAVRLLGPTLLHDLWINPPSPPVVEVIHAGGNGDMPSFLDVEARQARAANLPMRMIAVIDSDCDSADAEPSPAASRVTEAATRHGAQAFVLQKRTGENYIPDFYWRTEIERDPKNPSLKDNIEAVLSMSPDDRDFQNLGKLGLKQVAAKYDKARPYHLEILVKRVIDAQSDENLLTQMANDLRHRDHTNDLTAILDLIEQER